LATNCDQVNMKPGAAPPFKAWSQQWLQRIRATWGGAVAAWELQSQAEPLQRQTSGRPELGEVVDCSTDFIVQFDPAGAVSYLNPALRAAMGVPAGESVGHLSARDVLTPATWRQWTEDIIPTLQSESVWVGESTLNIGGRSEVPFSHMVMVHRDGEGKVLRYSAVLREISSEVQARQQILRQTEILRAITDAIPSTVVIVGSDGRYRFVNKAFERAVGRGADQILGRTAVEVLGADEVARRRPFMLKAFAGESVQFMLDYPGEQGSKYLALSCIPLKLGDAMDGFVGISQDVTLQQREHERLTHLAERDPLTGLLNRAGFEQYIERKIANGEGPTMALLYIDLDHFKPVNDQYGHLTGDGLLQRFARRLGETVRLSDGVARLGGDEFAILLTGVADHAIARAVADKVLAAASRPFDIDGIHIRVSASVGVAVAAQTDKGWRELMARADTLLYRAKAAGRGRSALHGDESPE
jgi:diguanylate cyclase (GGDEF)-like protein/PAS domain S-box-containing protein